MCCYTNLCSFFTSRVYENGPLVRGKNLNGSSLSVLDLSKLDPLFSKKLVSLTQLMADKGYDINPYYGLRTLDAQAKLWRQSRSTNIVNDKILELRGQKCDFLADILKNVGPQPSGPWATNALPGQSYHMFGLAADCLIKPGTDVDYKVYADTAVSLGLTAGYYFKSVDMGHVQLGSSNIPFNYTLKQLNDYFRDKA